MAVPLLDNTQNELNDPMRTAISIAAAHIALLSSHDLNIIVDTI